MIIYAKLNDTYQKILWSEAFHTFQGVQNSISNTGSMEIPFEKFYEEEQNITDLFSDFGLI